MLTEAITPQWITEQMANFQIKNPRQLSIASGVRYESLTLALNGKREPSSEIKKTLYWYFRYRDAERQILAANETIENWSGLLRS
jgi:hypothetical protein